jgi:signal transduction histidine kinase
MSTPSPTFFTAPSGRQLTVATAATAGLLLLAGIWFQSRLGDRLLPHAFCISASEPLMLLHLFSDGLIAFAYLAIPWALLNIVRKRADIPFGWMAWVFGAFIVACGLTHALEMWTLWYPVYWYAGVAKAFTAAVSLGTAWLLYRLTPAALAFPSADQLRAANAALEREVAARREAERQLAAAHSELQRHARQTSEVLDRFFDEAPMGMALLDRHGRMLRMNPGLAAETGRKPGEYAQGVRDIAGMPPVVLEALDDVASGRETRRVFDAAGERAGQPRAWHCTMFPIEAPDGDRLVGAVVQDVTAQRRLEQERADALESLREADRRKDEFIAVLAHELRNPLAPVGTAAQILAIAGEDEPTAAKMAPIIERQVRHMARLLEDLLDVSRVLTGKLEVRLEPCDLGALAAQVADDHREPFQREGTTLQVDASPVQVQGDAVRLTQAIGNLLHNANKFAAGGKVQLATWRDEAAGEAVLRVQDDGPGIPDELQPLLFQPFAQGPQDAARSKGGLGLGLALTRTIAELHGGRIAAVNVEGGGARFELRLPLLRP